MALLLIIFFVSYAAFAIFFIRSTWNTSNRIQRIIVLGFFILLPSWDYVLGCVLYYTSWPIFPKIAIYETAEVDGIYYEGAYRSQLICADRHYLGNVTKNYLMVFSRHDFEKGYKYSEALIKKIEKCPAQSIPEVPAVYRCIPLSAPKNNSNYIPQQCDPVEHILSGYAVKLNSFKIGSFEMNSMEIQNRMTGKLMAEYKESVRWGYFPFFMWLNWEHATQVRHSKPDETRFYDFQYEVLKLNNEKGGRI